MHFPMMDSSAYHALVLLGCATFWYLTYRTLRPQKLHSALGIDRHDAKRDYSCAAVGAAATDADEDTAAVRTVGESDVADDSAALNERVDRAEDGQGNLVASADSFKVAVLTVPSDASGAIIGKDGAVIRQLQRSTRTRIKFLDRVDGVGDAATGAAPSVADEAGSAKTVQIRGEASCVHAAEEEIRRIIASVPRKESLELRLASRYIGPLIGKGGQQVRSLSAQSRCRIDVERDVFGSARSASDEARLVTLRGTRDQIDLAKTLIDQLCAEIDQRDGRRPNGALASTTSSSPAQQPQQQQQPQPPPAQPLQFASFPADAADEPINVCVTAVGDDPLHYFVLCDNEQSRSLTSLTRSMTEFYRGIEQQQDHPLRRDLRPGELVAAYFNEEDCYQRARIVSLEAGQLDVDYLDYGDSELVPVGKVFRLQPQFCELPVQAIRCTLDAQLVLPASQSEECIAEFQRLTKCATYQPIRARLIRFKPDTGEPVLQLLTPVENYEICVTEELRQLGFLA